MAKAQSIGDWDLKERTNFGQISRDVHHAIRGQGDVGIAFSGRRTENVTDAGAYYSRLESRTDSTEVELFRLSK